MRQQRGGLRDGGDAAVGGCEAVGAQSVFYERFEGLASAALVASRSGSDFVVRAANSPALELLGVEAHELLDRKLSDVFRMEEASGATQVAASNGSELAGIVFTPTPGRVRLAVVNPSGGGDEVILLLEDCANDGPVPGSVSDLLGGDTEACAYVDSGGIIQYATGWLALLARAPTYIEGLRVEEFFAPVGTPAPGVPVRWAIPGPDGSELCLRAMLTETAATRLIHLRVCRPNGLDA